MRVMLLAACVSVCVASPIARQSAPPAVQPPGAAAPAASSAPAMTDAEIENFLTHARIVRTKSASKGVTGSLRATLSDGVLTHDAHIQTIDEKKQQFESAAGIEFNFQDSWKFNVAAYRLDRLLGINMTPVSVERRFDSQPAAFTWWVDGVLMDEGQRLKNKTQPPAPAAWNQQMQLVRMFDQLIYNVDRNMGNLLIGKDWRVWMIDHTRAFRTMDKLKSAANVTRCDRDVLQRLKQLDQETLKQQIGKYVTEYQIKALLARRDAIVAIIEHGGPGAVFSRHSQ